MQIVILGGGESGIGAAILGKQQGHEIFVSDSNSIPVHYKEALQTHQIPFEEQTHSTTKIFAAELIVKSPGIPESTPLITQLKDHKIPIISEIEFASRYTKAIIIGITGSNGKTTTTLLTHHLLKKEGLDIGIAGNIGKSFAYQVATEKYAHYVLELSSFQLDGIETFKPHIAIITNITPDHLDRYEQQFDKYIEAKFRITKNQTAEDYLLYDAEDPVITAWLKKHQGQVKAQCIPFSINKTYPALKGRHNQKNATAANEAAALLLKKPVNATFEDFKGAPHRLEYVRTVDNITYINDSKATNTDAAFYALESMTNPTIWIVGGLDKGNDYELLLPLVKKHVKAIVCLGLDNQKIKAFFEKHVPHFTESLTAKEAVTTAHQLANSGDTVLLSPACASFDLFKNYEARGDQFKEAVTAL